MVTQRLDNLRPCPFCGKSELHTNRYGHVRCVNDECFQNQFIGGYAWQNRPIEDALQNQLNVMSEHSAALAVSNYDLIAENNALQQRVEKLEMNIKEAVKEIDNVLDKASFIQFEYEDELPKNISKKVFEAMFKCSHVDGVRLYPYIEEDGERYFLIKLEDK